MGCIPQGDRNSEVDLECGAIVSKDDLSGSPISGVKAQPKVILSRISCVLSEGLSKCAEDVGSMMTHNIACEGYVKLEGEKTVDLEKAANENRKKRNSKTPPKPPRPPRSPSLDAADEKLIKELSELAMLRRMRIERIKALKKLKASKASPASSTSSNSSLLASVFTVVFCLVILFQGMSSRVHSSNPKGSPVPIGSTNDGGLISVQHIGSQSSGGQSLQGFPSHRSIHTAGFDPATGLQNMLQAEELQNGIGKDGK